MRYPPSTMDLAKIAENQQAIYNKLQEIQALLLVKGK